MRASPVVVRPVERPGPAVVCVVLEVLHDARTTLARRKLRGLYRTRASIQVCDAIRTTRAAIWIQIADAATRSAEGGKARVACCRIGAMPFVVVVDGGHRDCPELRRSG
jgi:hypothetical protein